MPKAFKPTKPRAKESGMAIITTKEALEPNGARVKSTNTIAIKKSIPRPDNRSFTFSA